MRDCASIRDDLKAYVDGELPLVRRVVVRVHLARCAGCRKEAAALVRIAEELRARDAGELGAALRYRILADAVETASQRRPQPVAPSPRRLRPLPAWSAAAAAALLIVAFYPLLNRSLESSIGEQMDRHEAPSRLSESSGQPVSPESAGAARETDASAKPHGGAERGRASSRPSPAGPVEAARSTSRVAGPAGGAPPRASAAPVAPSAAEPSPAGAPEEARMSKAAIAPKSVRLSADSLLLRQSDAGVVPEEPGALAERVSAPERPRTDVQPAAPGGAAGQAVTLDLEVDQVEARVADVAAIAREADGAVDRQLVSKGDALTETAVVELRVPADRAEEVVRSVARLGTVVHSGTHMASSPDGAAAGALGGGFAQAQGGPSGARGGKSEANAELGTGKSLLAPGSAAEGVAGQGRMGQTPALGQSLGCAQMGQRPVVAQQQAGRVRQQDVRRRAETRRAAKAGGEPQQSGGQRTQAIAGRGEGAVGAAGSAAHRSGPASLRNSLGLQPAPAQVTLTIRLRQRSGVGTAAPAAPPAEH